MGSEQREIDAEARRWASAIRDRSAEIVAVKTRGFWERVIDYIVIAFVYANAPSLVSNVSFLIVFVVFLALFFGASHVDAAITLALQTRQGASSATFLHIASKILSLSVDYVTLLALTLIVSQTTSFISDGSWSLLNLVMPAAVVIGFLIECAHLSLSVERASPRQQGTCAR